MDRELSGLIAEFDRAVASWCADPTGEPDAAYTTRLLVERGVWDSLLTEWRAATDDPVAARRLAWTLTEQGDRRAAQRALDQAADLGDLPVLAARAGRGGIRGRAARARYERARERVLRNDEQAAAQGDPHASYRLSLVRAAQAEQATRRWRESGLRRGDPGHEVLENRMHQLSDAARRLESKAADGGSAEAALSIGHRAYMGGSGDQEAFGGTQRQLAKAGLPWFTRADELGSAEGSLYLGRVLLDLKKLDRAEAALRRALDRGHTQAPVWLAMTLTRRRPPDWAEAEGVYRRAIDRGLPRYAGLAECLEHLGDTEGAERAWRQAAERSEFSAAWLDRERATARRSAARYRARMRRPGGEDASR